MTRMDYEDSYSYTLLIKLNLGEAKGLKQILE